MRRPRFALVLLAIAVPVVALLAATHRRAQGPTAAAPDRPVRACATTRASAQTTVRDTVKVRARVTYPIAVTARAQHGRNIVSVTRSASIVEDARLQRPISATAKAVVPSRACASGSSPGAARAVALQRAYQAALAGAHKRSSVAAIRRARQLAADLQRAQLTQARKLATARARKVAERLRPSLERNARRQATAEAARG